MTRNQIINTVAAVERRSCVLSDDRRFLIGMTATGVIVVDDYRQSTIVSLGRFRHRSQLFRFLVNAAKGVK